MAKPMDLANRLVGGRLEALLAQWRVDDISYDQIAKKLGDLDVMVTGETVRRWCAIAGVDDEYVKWAKDERAKAEDAS